METPFASGIPLVLQLYLVVRDEILDGRYLDGAEFPGEVELAERFRVSVITSRAVLQRLASEGMIERARGKRPRAIYFPSEALLNETPVVLPAFTYEVLSATMDVAPWRACRALGKKPGATAWQLVRLRLLDGEPHSVTVSYQPEEIGLSHTESDLKTCTIPQLLARAGAPVLNVDREVSVAFAPTMVAQPLDVFLAQTVLLVTVTLKSHEHDAVDWSRIYYRPGRSQTLATVAVENGPSD